MGRKGQWKENLVSALEIPGDLAYGDSLVTLTGPREVRIENFRCLASYTSSEIVVLTLRGKVTICGDRLEIPWFTRNEMKIRGCITGIFPQM